MPATVCEMRALKHAAVPTFTGKSRAIRRSSARGNARNTGNPKVSRSPLIGVIVLETITLVMLDATKRRGINLVQDHAKNPIQQP
jgi:hypothetical protein